jgi:hypothetical protein
VLAGDHERHTLIWIEEWRRGVTDDRCLQGGILSWATHGEVRKTVMEKENTCVQVQHTVASFSSDPVHIHGHGDIDAWWRGELARENR